MSTRNPLHGLAFGLIFVTLIGCGSSGPSTNSVTGKVTIGDQPAANIQVSFQPMDEENQAASGRTGDDGTYTMYTGISGTPGVMLGKYKVVLTPDMSADTSYMDSGADAPPDTSGGVPEEYRDVATTPKEVEVKAGGNTIDIEI